MNPVVCSTVICNLSAAGLRKSGLQDWDSGVKLSARCAVPVSSLCVCSSCTSPSPGRSPSWKWWVLGVHSSWGSMGIDSQGFQVECVSDLCAGLWQVKWSNPDVFIAQYCQICCKGDHEELLLLCDGCDRGCHTYCHKPKITSIPDGDWFCPACISQVQHFSRSVTLSITSISVHNSMLFCFLVIMEFQKNIFTTFQFILTKNTMQV